MGKTVLIVEDEQNIVDILSRCIVSTLTLTDLDELVTVVSLTGVFDELDQRDVVGVPVVKQVVLSALKAGVKQQVFGQSSGRRHAETGHRQTAQQSQRQHTDQQFFHGFHNCSLLIKIYLHKRTAIAAQHGSAVC